MDLKAHTPATLRRYTPEQPLRLADGGSLAGATVAYQTWGRLNASGDNVIWVCHALTASSDVESWWPGLFGRGRTLDPDRHFIVCANVLGGCYGSAGPRSINPQTGSEWGADFPRIGIADIVAQQRQLADHLGVRGIELVLGASMGGFQVLEWARAEPLRVRRIAVIASSWRQPPQALALAELQCTLIRRDPRFLDGRYHPSDPPSEGLALARQLGHISYRSPRELDLRFGRERRADGHFQVNSYLDHQGAKLVRRFDALSYLRLTEAMNHYEFAADPAALGAVRQPALVVALDSDQLYHPEEQRRLAAALGDGRLEELSTLHGHDGFLVDAARLDALLRPFLDEGPFGLPESVASHASKTAATSTRTEILRSQRPALPLALLGASGKVGRAFLDRLQRAEPALPVELLGVANSRAAVWQERGLPPGLALERLHAQQGGDGESLLRRLLRRGAPAVVVDCTANAAIAGHAARLLEAGIALVSANKIAFAAGHQEWLRLRDALDAGGRAAWSATVGAGLPILGTLRRLRAAGDPLLSLEAGLSGTLAHVLDACQRGASLLAAAEEAIALGLAEPDPRLDLGGVDVLRKLHILLRAAGREGDALRIRHRPLLDLPTDGDWREALRAAEPAWQRHLQEAAASGTRLAYVASWSAEQGAEVGLRALTADHFLASARGCENRALLRSLAHQQTAIAIAGSGAGVEVTAAALLADLVELLSQLSPREFRHSRQTVPSAPAWLQAAVAG